MKNSNLAFVILAAGKGKRMNNPDIPKVLAELNNKPLIGYVIDQVEKLNSAQCIFIIGHHKEKVENFIKSYIGNKFNYNLRICIII